MAPSIISFLRPRGVVVVGASTSPEKLGYGVTRNLVQSGYRGAVHLVSQRQGALFGLPLRSTLEDVPDPVDLAILIVPPDATPAALEKCGRRGIHAAIVVSAGFREAGAE
ncbi:MAG TPA: CoA-binding protein, partial [Anaerolineales bacterium]